MSRVSLNAATFLLDEGALTQARQEVDELVEQLQRLEEDVTGALCALQVGFHTPAGHQFLTSSANTLIEPLNNLEAALTQVSQTLGAAAMAYSPDVSDAYNALKSEMGAMGYA